LEFPDVFNDKRSGFQAVIGNPPWDTLQPMSKEFFSNLDPLYRSYGKQEARRTQTEIFERSVRDEKDWLAYQGYFKAYTNFLNHSAWPFGDPDAGGANFSIVRGNANAELHAEWRSARRRYRGYTISNHPYRDQGAGKAYTYKLFLEQSHNLLREDGRLGLIVPSGLYTDKGSSDLRKLLLERARWEWLFGFENREGIFDIHRSFKFCPIIVAKGRRTDAIRATFMQRDLEAWAEAEKHVIPYEPEQVQKFSPHSFAILELRNRRDMEILEKIYANSVLLGDQSEDGWQLEYRQGDFNMTSDSRLFPPRPAWEAKGYKPDEYSRWLLGKWRPREKGSPAPPDSPRWELEPGVILSRDEDEWIHEGEIEEIALPLYQGVMIGQLNSTASCFSAGSGNRAVWAKQPLDDARITPQFLINTELYLDRSSQRGHKLAFRDTTNATNERTMIASVLPDMPCGNVLGLLHSKREPWVTAVFLSSFVFDWAARQRIGGTHLNWYVVEELPLPSCDLTFCKDELRVLALKLIGIGPQYANAWNLLRSHGSVSEDLAWQDHWVVEQSERLRLRCILDALSFYVYGLDYEDALYMLSDCASAPGDSNQRVNPKGFWRVDANSEPELRHSVLALAAFRDLLRRIVNEDPSRPVNDFLYGNSTAGWTFPETLSLAELGYNSTRPPKNIARELGSDDLGRELTRPQDSWNECNTHAYNLRQSYPAA
jgi:hypothetical protein